MSPAKSIVSEVISFKSAVEPPEVTQAQLGQHFPVFAPFNANAKDVLATMSPSKSARIA